MNLDTLGAIAEIMQKYDLTHVNITVDGDEVELDRSDPAAPSSATGSAPSVVMVPVPAAQGAPAASAYAPAPAGAPAPTATSQPVSSPVVAPAAAPVEEGVTEVEAPMVGVFYTAPAPGAEPFVRIGSKVHRGDTLCIVEAMKYMNEVQSEVDGTVIDICASDGELVEYGRPLMKIS